MRRGARCGCRTEASSSRRTVSVEATYAPRHSREVWHRPTSLCLYICFRRSAQYWNECVITVSKIRLVLHQPSEACWAAARPPYAFVPPKEGSAWGLRVRNPSLRPRVAKVR